MSPWWIKCLLLINHPKNNQPLWLGIEMTISQCENDAQPRTTSFGTTWGCTVYDFLVSKDHYGSLRRPKTNILQLKIILSYLCCCSECGRIFWSLSLTKSSSCVATFLCSLHAPHHPQLLDAEDIFLQISHLVQLLHLCWYLPDLWWLHTSKTLIYTCAGFKNGGGGIPKSSNIKPSINHPVLGFPNLRNTHVMGQLPALPPPR